jgi:hypothetical protein
MRFSVQIKYVNPKKQLEISITTATLVLSAFSVS